MRSLRINNQEPGTEPIALRVGEEVVVSLELTGEHATAGDGWQIAVTGGGIQFEGERLILPASVPDPARYAVRAPAGFTQAGDWHIQLVNFDGPHSALAPIWDVAVAVHERQEQPQARRREGEDWEAQRRPEHRPSVAATKAPGRCQIARNIGLGGLVVLLVTLALVTIFAITFFFGPLRFAGIRAADADAAASQKK